MNLIFSTISSVIIPQTQDARVPVLRDFQMVDEDEASSSVAPRLSYTETGVRIVNQQTLPKSLSFSNAIIKNFNNLCKRNSTHKVKLEYFNGKTWLKDIIVIDTGAYQCNCITPATLVTTTQNYSFVTYDGQRTTLTQQS